MFRKTKRRNIRERKDDSSEEEKKEDEDDGEMPSVQQIKPSKLSQTRGITCSSRVQKAAVNSDSSGEDNEMVLDSVSNRAPVDKNVKEKSTSKMFSFSDDNDGE